MQDAWERMNEYGRVAMAMERNGMSEAQIREFFLGLGYGAAYTLEVAAAELPENQFNITQLIEQAEPGPPLDPVDFLPVRSGGLYIRICQN